MEISERLDACHEPPLCTVIQTRIAEALADTPVVLIAGPMQAGKTTLARGFAQAQGLRYLTLDDDLTLLAAREDPVGMIRSLDRSVIDGIERPPRDAHRDQTKRE